MLRHIYNVVRAVIREGGKRSTRSPQWPALERKTLLMNPRCSACGESVRLQVHHIQPYHLYPSLELDPSNLIVLCMGPRECHLTIGHGGDFKAWNPGVEADAAEVFLRSEQYDTVVARAKAQRQFIA